MAIIVDTNCLSPVFNRGDKTHDEFKPVLDWILNGSGFLVWGGTKYYEELLRTKKYLKIFRLLSELNKAVRVNTEKVDTKMHYYEQFRNHDFDDPHLPAIVVVSKCRLICSKDQRSVDYVTDKRFYPKKFKIPKYYQGRRDIGLLCSENIDPDLLNYRTSLNKKTKELINEFLEKLENNNSHSNNY